MTFTKTPLTVKDASNDSQPIIAYYDGTNSAFAHPLLDSTGAIIDPATSEAQAAGNAALAAIQASVVNIPVAPATAANQATANTALGAPADAAVTNPASSTSIIGALKGMLSNLGTIATSLASIAAYLAPVTGKIAMPALDTTYTAGRYFVVNASIAGNVSITYSDSSTDTIPVSAGVLTVIRAAVTTVNSSGTTATATYENWK